MSVTGARPVDAFVIREFSAGQPMSGLALAERPGVENGYEYRRGRISAPDSILSAASTAGHRTGASIVRLEVDKLSGIVETQGSTQQTGDSRVRES